MLLPAKKIFLGTLIKNLRYFFLRDSREEKLSTLFSNIIFENNNKKKIKVIDYGSGFQPIVSYKLRKKLKKKKISSKFLSLDIYNNQELKKLNKSNFFIFRNILDLKTTNKKYDFAIISDVLHHLSEGGVNNTVAIKSILFQLKKKSNYIIIKDVFERNLFDRIILIFMDFVGNYHNETLIPKNYFNKNKFENLLHSSNFKIVKKYENVRVYSKFFLFFSNPSLHSVYVIK
jgi:hypothetical protein